MWFDAVLTGRVSWEGRVCTGSLEESVCVLCVYGGGGGWLECDEKREA